MPSISDDLSAKIEVLKSLFDVEVEDEIYDPVRFGNGVLTLRSSTFSLRIIRDRGQLFIEVAKPGASWVDASDVLKTLSKIDIATSPSEFDLLYEHLCSDAAEFRSEVVRR